MVGASPETCTGTHPDNQLATKLQWLKQIKRHLSVPQETELWIWCAREIFVSSRSFMQSDRPLPPAGSTF